jgi:hypothetical protein
LALLGHNNYPMSKTLPFLGLQQPVTRAKQAQHGCHVPQKSSILPWWRPDQLSQRPICKGLIPISYGLCQNVLMRASLFFSAQGLVTNPVLPLPSQRPSDGLFSPMEVRTNHLPMCTDPLVPVRRVWSCTSKATPSRGSSVQDIIAM